MRIPGPGEGRASGVPRVTLSHGEHGSPTPGLLQQNFQHRLGSPGRGAAAARLPPAGPPGSVQAPPQTVVMASRQPIKPASREPGSTNTLAGGLIS